jgi:hypothetical protein
MKNLFNSTDYEIIKLDSTPGFTFGLYYFEKLKNMRRHLCKIYPKLFAEQFIFVLKLIH